MKFLGTMRRVLVTIGSIKGSNLLQGLKMLDISIKMQA